MTRAERRAEHQAARATALARRLESLLPLRGHEHVLDVGCGAGAFAYAVAPAARSVVAVDSDAAMVEVARASAPANVEVQVADGELLPFDDAVFDVAATLRTLHHTEHPDRLVAELARVTKPRGTVLVVDQLAPHDEEQALALNEFERARDRSTSRVLPEQELRLLLEQTGLSLRRSEVLHESRDLGAYLDLAGCEGPERDRIAELAPPGYEAVVGWFVLLRP
jgi:ubiquinone/menaquinone biosynthesis C-methylase UbiE